MSPSFCPLPIPFSPFLPSEALPPHSGLTEVLAWVVLCGAGKRGCLLIPRNQSSFDNPKHLLI